MEETNYGNAMAALAGTVCRLPAACLARLGPDLVEDRLMAAPDR